MVRESRFASAKDLHSIVSFMENLIHLTQDQGQNINLQLLVCIFLINIPLKIKIYKLYEIYLFNLFSLIVGNSCYFFMIDSIYYTKFLVLELGIIS